MLLLIRPKSRTVGGSLSLTVTTEGVLTMAGANESTLTLTVSTEN